MIKAIQKYFNQGLKIAQKNPIYVILGAVISIQLYKKYIEQFEETPAVETEPAQEEVEEAIQDAVAEQVEDVIEEKTQEKKQDNLEWFRKNIFEIIQTLLIIILIIIVLTKN